MTLLHKVFRLAGGLLAVIGLIALLVISTPIVSWWVRAYCGPFKQPPGDILIVLGAAPDDHGFLSYSSYWRARAAVSAWQKGHFSKIIISGGGPAIASYLAAEGIPQDAIITDWRSSSTHESGLAMAQLLGEYSGKKVLLTSDFHLYRAVRVFRKCGVAVDAMAAPDLLNLTEHWNGRLPAFQSMLIESTKLAYYAIRGWI